MPGWLACALKSEGLEQVTGAGMTRLVTAIAIFGVARPAGPVIVWSNLLPGQHGGRLVRSPLRRRRILP
jgi:hypothetical protein